MKIKRSRAVFLSLLTAFSFTCSGVFASKISLDDMATLQHKSRKRHNAVISPAKGAVIESWFKDYKEEDAIYAPPGKKKIKINNGVRIIGKNAFLNRDDIDEVIIPESVQLIDDSAFVGCKSLTKIVIEGEVSIGQYAFLNCKKLVEIFIEGTIKSVNVNSFFGCNCLRLIRDLGIEPLRGSVLDTISISSSKPKVDEFGNLYSDVHIFNY